MLNALARNFAVCDNWFSSLPGPTLPNRYFLYGASSGGFDNSPSSVEMFEWEYISGFKLPNGSILDALKKRLPRSAYRIYTGCWLSMIRTLQGGARGAPRAVAPGDHAGSKHNKYGCASRLGNTWRRWRRSSARCRPRGARRRRLGRRGPRSPKAIRASL